LAVVESALCADFEPEVRHYNKFGHYQAGPSFDFIMPKPISLYIIAYQEVANLRAVLLTVLWADDNVSN